MPGPLFPVFARLPTSTVCVYILIKVNANNNNNNNKSDKSVVFFFQDTSWQQQQQTNLLFNLNKHPKRLQNYTFLYPQNAGDSSKTSRLQGRPLGPSPGLPALRDRLHLRLLDSFQCYLLHFLHGDESFRTFLWNTRQWPQRPMEDLWWCARLEGFVLCVSLPRKRLSRFVHWFDSTIVMLCSGMTVMALSALRSTAVWLFRYCVNDVLIWRWRVLYSTVARLSRCHEFTVMIFEQCWLL